jgi:hypothetical protein
MQSTPSADAALPPSWPDALARVQEAIRQASEMATEREKAFAVLPQADPAAARQAKWQQCLARLHHRFAALEACAARASQNAEQANAALDAAEEAFRQWLAESQKVTQKLAEWGTKGVR